jgi:hypothetical protein
MMLPLDEFARKAIAEAEPLSQNTEPDNLGFGWLYYGLVRNLRPDLVVAIGSRRGFMPFCAARGVQDNGRGHVLFVDPSYCGGGHPAWSGAGLWSDPGEVDARIADFGLTGWVTHLRKTSDEAFDDVRQAVENRSLQLVIVDGAHTFEQSLRDFDLYSSLMVGGLVLLHDSTNEACEVSRTVAELRSRGYPVVTIYRDVGLTLVGVSRVPVVQETWGYLVKRSNRAERLLPLAQRVIRPGDRVLEIYCGYSPLPSVLTDIQIIGWDRDPTVIARLRAEQPQHRWLQVDERQLLLAELPDEVDVLTGLGLSRSYAPWDPQLVLENVRYLLGRYAPRDCLFEAAADYNGADILDDLRTVLERLGYTCTADLIETDMEAFPRRAVLIARRDR